MYYDLIEYVSDEHNGKEKVISNYKLSHGLYLKFNENGISDTLIVPKPKEGNDSAMDTTLLYNWFKERHYLSKCVNINKYLDTKKKFHNSNYLSLFFKVKTALLPDDEVNKYYERFYMNMVNKLNSKDDIPSELKNDIPELNLDLLNKLKEIFFRNISYATEMAKENKIDGYICFFYDAPLDQYQREFSRYISKNSFAVSEYNIDISNKTYGVSPFNMSINEEKKPYLRAMSTYYCIPFRISYNNALKGLLLADWLKPQRSGYLDAENLEQFALDPKINRNQAAHYLNISLDNGNPVIDDYGYLPHYIYEEIIFEFTYCVQLNNTLDNKIIYEYIKTSNTWEMFNFISKIIFKGKLQKLICTNIKDIKENINGKMRNFLGMYGPALKNFFIKRNDYAIIKCLDSMTRYIIINNISTEHPEKNSADFNYIGIALNLRFALLKYFKIGSENNMALTIKTLSDNLFEKISSKFTDNEIPQLNSDDEFFFAAGQLARYLLTLSKAQNILLSYVKSCGEKKDADSLKKEIMFMIKKYDHNMSLTSRRLTNLMSIVLGYDKNPKMNDIMFYCGLSTQNIMYKKGAVENEKEQ